MELVCLADGDQGDNINLTWRARQRCYIANGASASNEYELVAARQDNGGTDNVQSFSDRDDVDGPTPAALFRLSESTYGTPPDAVRACGLVLPSSLQR